ncbi:MAG TPA: LuxR C-terminal-related transcriptional regulator [Kineosporiaceae bacterium]|nr:LuxR C-terminal-related transcriptional regulator [Kineosporiaceae bacterium]
MGEGLTNRQVAERADLAEKTVKNNMSRLLTKLGLQRRTQSRCTRRRDSPQRPVVRTRRPNGVCTGRQDHLTHHGAIGHGGAGREGLVDQRSFTAWRSRPHPASR